MQGGTDMRQRGMFTLLRFRASTPWQSSRPHTSNTAAHYEWTTRSRPLGNIQHLPRKSLETRAVLWYKKAMHVSSFIKTLAPFPSPIATRTRHREKDSSPSTPLAGKTRIDPPKVPSNEPKNRNRVYRASKRATFSVPRRSSAHPPSARSPPYLSCYET